MNELLTELRELQGEHGFWYIATPYSKYPAGIHVAFEDACRASAFLIERGVRVYCPIAHTHPIAMHGNIDPLDHKIWIPVDSPLMHSACGLLVVQMPTWELSYGIGVEVEAFKEQSKPVRYAEWPLA